MFPIVTIYAVNDHICLVIRCPASIVNNVLVNALTNIYNCFVTGLCVHLTRGIGLFGRVSGVSLTGIGFLK